MTEGLQTSQSALKHIYIRCQRPNGLTCAPRLRVRAKPASRFCGVVIVEALSMRESPLKDAAIAIILALKSKTVYGHLLMRVMPGR